MFGFNRLSFIDIEHSHQPMPYADGRYRIVFNGEIYNYLELRAELAEAGATFATEGDTEAIVAGYHLWGEAIVPKLRGMFAFVIWDSETNTVFGARDPFGIKPLFTARLADGGIVFASEKKALLELLGGSKAAGGVDPASLQHYLTLQYVPEPATMHRGIRRIESGTQLHRRRRRAAARSATSTPPSRSGRSAKDEQQALYDRIADVLDDSVRMHMRADVTVGSFLSGGIDSTAIAALAKRYNPKLLTFTTGFEREGFSEIDVAAESAAAIGVEHITKVVTPEEFADVDPAGGLVPRRPGRRPRARAAVLHRPRGPQARQGGALRRGRRRAVRRLQHLPRAAVAGGVREAARAASAAPWARCRPGCPTGCAARTCSAAARSRWSSGTTATPGSSGTTNWASCARRDADQSHVTVTRELYQRTRAAGYDDVTAMQYVDLFTWLRGDILVKADKMTMANSLELRVPFLDSEVFKVASTLPVDQRVTKETTKYALRRALEQIVPGARAEPAQARLPRADPVLAGRAAARLGAADHHREPDRRVAGQAAGARDARRAPGEPAQRLRGRLLAQALDAAGLHDLARHLRRGADHPRRPRAGLPRPAS